jgi:hypothetical protein
MYDTDDYGPPMTMAEESSWQHANFGTCSFDCWRCQPMDDQSTPAYTISTAYGTQDFETYAEAKMAAMTAAKVTGKAVTVTRNEI